MNPTAVENFMMEKYIVVCFKVRHTLVFRSNFNSLLVSRQIGQIPEQKVE